MSQKSFAIVSIVAALICGKFFYPNSPRKITPMAAPTSSVAPKIVTAHEVSNRPLPQSTCLVDTKAINVIDCDVAASITTSMPNGHVAYGMVK
jgi:hypothetical protein